ncbi:hypothetical protein Q31a_50680 [Aureliella helgolandensis]|uniref:Uncharacterized protein n=2 Tax=Aureliella helgolandensis TaxID=2527968 RepID=A0A518GDM2_9BACT|nr:hypothetical protein Q31a_50680 [Aureliella helgolandensis]
MVAGAIYRPPGGLSEGIRGPACSASRESESVGCGEALKRMEVECLPLKPLLLGSDFDDNEHESHVSNLLHALGGKRLARRIIHFAMHGKYR